MRTSPRGYVAALLGSVLGAVLFAWLGNQFVLATHRPDPNVPSTVGPIFAAVFAMGGLGWLGTGLGCAVALQLRRVPAIGRTAALTLLLSPLAAVLYVTLGEPLLDRVLGVAAGGSLWAVVLLVALIGIASVLARWIVLRLAGRRARSEANSPH